MTKETPVLLPPLGGDDMESATLVEWVVKTGDQVREGDTLVQVETAKATIEVNAPADGYFRSGLVKLGDEVPVGAILAHIVPTFAEATKSSENLAVEGGTKSTGVSDQDLVTFKVASSRATPGARRLAREKGIHLEDVQRSKDTIAEADVLRHLGESEARPKERGVQTSGYRSAMARAMEMTTSIPQFNVAVDCDGETLFEIRQQLQSRGTNVSINDLVIWCVSRALQEHKDVRMYWNGSEAILPDSIDIAFAISTSHGLVAPVIHGANGLSLDSISAEASRLRVLAEARKLSATDVTGGTFSISNLGSLGVSDFTAVVTPGQGAILAVPGFQPTPRMTNGQTIWRRTARLRITADHRIVTGAEVAQFLQRLRSTIEGLQISTIA